VAFSPTVNWPVLLAPKVAESAAEPKRLKFERLR
jgi:hypothetical protein